MQFVYHYYRKGKHYKCLIEAESMGDAYRIVCNRKIHTDPHLWALVYAEHYANRLRGLQQLKAELQKGV